MTAIRIAPVGCAAAGMGTRFLPATRSMPKETLPIVDKPVPQFVESEERSS